MLYDESEYEYTLKLLILGGSSVGKSNFICRFIENKFCDYHIASTGLELKTSEISINNKKIRVQLWDTVGQDKYKSITKSLFPKVQGIIAMFDLTNEDSFEKIKSWIKLIKEENGNRTPIILVGNKADLEDLIIISENEINKYVNKQQIPYIMTSSKTNLNVQKAVNIICQEVLSLYKEDKLDCSFNLSLPESSMIKRSRCCSKS